MQYLSSTDIAPLSAIAALAAREPVAFSSPAGAEMVVMTLEEYNRITHAETDAFKASWRALGEEAQKNGLTPQKLEEIIADVR